MSLRKKKSCIDDFFEENEKNITYKKQFLEKSAITTTIKNYYDIKKLLYHYYKTEYKSSVNRIVETMTKTTRN